MKASTGNEIAATARLFSATVVRELSTKMRSSHFARLVGQCGLDFEFPSATNVGEVFELAFQRLSIAENRHDYVYRTALVRRILLGKHNLRTASMLPEFRVGNNRVDIGILNGTSTAYEIKSERDNLQKLSAQILAYRQVFASVNVICGANHTHAVQSMVPEDVGILELNNKFRITTVRQAKDLPSRVSQAAIFDSIRLQESALILKQNNVSLPVVPNTRLRSELEPLFLALSAEKAHEGLVTVLKQTRSLRPLHQFVEQVPNCLKPVALSLRLSQKQRFALLRSLDTPFREVSSWL